VLHLRAGGRVDKRLPGVPAAAHRLVQGDQAAHGVAAIDDVRVLLGRERALCIEHALEVRVPFAIDRVGERERALRRALCVVQDGVALECRDERRCRVVGLARRLAHGFLVGDDQLLEAGVLHAHVVRDEAVIEQVPGDARAAHRGERACRARERAGAPHKRADQRHGWVQVGFRDADQRGLRGHLLLRRANVGAAQQQIGGHILEHRPVDERDEARLGRLHVQLRQRAGRAAQQHAKRMTRHRDLALEYGNAAQRAEILGLRLLEIELVGFAALEELLRDLVAALLQLRVVSRDAQARFGRAQREIGVRDLRVNEHERVLAVVLRGEEGGVGRFDRAGEASPEVQFPADAEAETILEVRARTRVEAIVALARRVQHIGVGLLHLRVAPRERDAQLGPRLDHAQCGNLQVTVVRIGGGNQLFEIVVAEHAPPLPRVGLLPGW